MSSNPYVYASPHHSEHTVKGAPVPVGGAIFSILLSLTSVSILSYCLATRIPKGKLADVPFLRWLLLIIYVISMFFIVFSVVVGQAFGYNTGMISCGVGIFICLCSYMVSKVLIYLFMVERVVGTLYIVSSEMQNADNSQRIVHGSRQSRMKDKLFIFNAFVMLVPFAVVAILNFVYRVSFIDTKGMCHIGMQRKALIPLLLADGAANVYVTVLFILPLTKLKAFNQNQRNSRSAQLKALTTRSIIGCLLTISSTAANVISLIVVVGQPAWVCMTLCNLDVLFCVLVLHFITKNEQTDSPSSTAASYSLPMSKRSRTSHMDSEITVTRSVQVNQESKGSNDAFSDVEVVVETLPHKS